MHLCLQSHYTATVNKIYFLQPQLLCVLEQLHQASVNYSSILILLLVLIYFSYFIITINTTRIIKLPKDLNSCTVCTITISSLRQLRKAVMVASRLTTSFSSIFITRPLPKEAKKRCLP